MNSSIYLEQPKLIEPPIYKPGQYQNEIVLIVKMNSGFAYIMKEPIRLTYYRFDNTIIGTDGLFYNFYQKNWIGGFQDAFGGAKFTLTMHDGEEVHCTGEWWSAVSDTARMLIKGQRINHNGSASDLAKLQMCYVYNGYAIDCDKMQELIDRYTGNIYEYYEGEFIIKSWQKKHGKLKALITDYQGGKCVIDEHNDIYAIKKIQGKTYFSYSFEVGWHGLYKEYFTEGRKDFSIKEPRQKPEYHTCKVCGANDATIRWDNESYYCHLCDKQMTEEDNRQNYY